MGFFSDLKKNLQDEVEKNKELKDALGKLNKSKRGGKAKPAEAAKPSEAESNAKASTDEAFQAAQENLNKGAEQTKEALKSGKEMLGGLFGKAAEAKAKVAENIGNTEFAKTVKQASEEVKAKVGETEAAKKAREAAAKAAAAAADVNDAAGGLFENKHELGEKKGYFKDTKAAPVKEVPEEQWDTETTGLVGVKKKETNWDRQKAKLRQMANKHPALRGVLNFAERVGEKAGNVAGNTGDRVFGETDEGLTVYEIKERDPDFAMMGFMKEVREVIIPEVLQAYLEADEATIKARCSGQAYQTIFATVQERKHLGVTYDNRILAVRDVQLTGARVLDNGPTLVVQFNAQQIHCIRDKEGVIVDGAEDDVRAVFYTWAFQLDQDAYDLNWQLVEMQMMGAMKMI